ncbi:hypothetical protein YC2023_062362 [Brassica napus]
MASAFIFIGFFFSDIQKKSSLRVKSAESNRQARGVEGIIIIEPCRIGERHGVVELFSQSLNLGDGISSGSSQVGLFLASI